MAPVRWNDQAIDGLDQRLGDVQDEISVLRELPTAVAKVATSLEALKDSHAALSDAHLRADGREERRIIAVRKDLRDLRQDFKAGMDELTGLVEEGLAHQQQQAGGGIAWTTIAWAISVVVVPIVVSIIGTH